MKSIIQLGAVVFSTFITLVACNQQQPQSPTLLTTEPSVSIKVSNGTFTKGQNLNFHVVVENPTSSSGKGIVRLISSASISLDQTTFEVASNGNDQQIIDVQGKLKRAGYATVTALAQIENLATQPPDLVGFNIESDQVSNRNLSRQARNNAPGVESLEDHAKNLPVVSDFSLHVEQVKADLANLDDVRQDYRYDGIQFMNLDGTLRSPEKMTIGYAPETGQGQPLPGELEGYANQKSTVKRQTRSWCGSQSAKLHVDLTNIYSNIPNPPIPGRINTLIPNNFYIKIVDDNGIMPHVVFAEGQLDSSGNFSYTQPLCDTFSPFWSDYSPPDIYFLVEARIPANNSNGYHEAIRVVDTFGTQHYFRSGTY